jgi:hypothetical protein
MRTFDIEQALKAQAALRLVAGLDVELFSVPAFVGMSATRSACYENLENLMRKL